jgi:hypothetical protein
LAINLIRVVGAGAAKCGLLSSTTITPIRSDRASTPLVERHTGNNGERGGTGPGTRERLRLRLRSIRRPNSFAIATERYQDSKHARSASLTWISLASFPLGEGAFCPSMNAYIGRIFATGKAMIWSRLTWLRLPACHHSFPQLLYMYRRGESRLSQILDTGVATRIWQTATYLSLAVGVFGIFFLLVCNKSGSLPLTCAVATDCQADSNKGNT